MRHALELGYRLIDTAEMYGEGGAETVVGRALAEALRAGTLRRDEVVVVSKIYPHNASRRGTPAACERSLKRLGTDRVDVVHLHSCEKDVLERGVGIRFNGVEKTNVEEYSVSEGWIRVAAGRSRDRFGNPMTVKLKGVVEPYYEARADSSGDASVA